MEILQDTLIIRIEGERVVERADRLAAEASFTVLVNGEELVSLLCTPYDMDAMAIGFLVSEGLLDQRRNLLSVTVDTNAAAVDVQVASLSPGWRDDYRRQTITSGCGRGVTYSRPDRFHGGTAGHREPLISAAGLSRLLGEFAGISPLFRETGGTHSAALVGDGAFLLHAEDIGRHNAVDKVVGKAFARDLPLDDKLLLSSGRVSAEIMGKAIRSRIPLVVSRAAPTCMSVSLAEDHGVTLVGFARGRRFNIYTHPARIRIEEA